MGHAGRPNTPSRPKSARQSPILGQRDNAITARNSLILSRKFSQNFDDGQSCRQETRFEVGRDFPTDGGLFVGLLIGVFLIISSPSSLPRRSVRSRNTFAMYVCSLRPSQSWGCYAARRCWPRVDWARSTWSCSNVDTGGEFRETGARRVRCVITTHGWVRFCAGRADS
jgi:hypothetical protein